MNRFVYGRGMRFWSNRLANGSDLDMAMFVDRRLGQVCLGQGDEILV